MTAYLIGHMCQLNLVTIFVAHFTYVVHHRMPQIYGDLDVMCLVMSCCVTVMVLFVAIVLCRNHNIFCDDCDF